MGIAMGLGVGTKGGNILENVLDKPMGCGYSMGMSITYTIYRDRACVVEDRQVTIDSSSESGRAIRDAVHRLYGKSIEAGMDPLLILAYGVRIDSVN